jgi:hypothetical protein
MPTTTSQHPNPDSGTQLPAGLEPVTLAAAGTWDLMVDRVVPHPPARVWTALTAPDVLAQWARSKPSVRSPRPGRCD